MAPYLRDPADVAASDLAPCRSAFLLAPVFGVAISKRELQMGTKTKVDATSALHLIMGEVHALVEMVVPSNEDGDIAMTPAILDQITAIQDRACDALGLKRRPTIPPNT